MADTPQSFEAVRNRLDEILDAVNSDDIELEEALALYEEAVKLGLAACDLSEIDIEEAEAAVAPAEGRQSEGAAHGADEAASEQPDAAEAPRTADGEEPGQAAPAAQAYGPGPSAVQAASGNPSDFGA